MLICRALGATVQLSASEGSMCPSSAVRASPSRERFVLSCRNPVKGFDETWPSPMLSLGFLLATTAAQAQTFPSKTVTIVVTAAAGGVSDVVARAVGQRLSEAWGQQVVIENKGGGAHIIGAQVVAKAPPDGHTLLVAEAGTYVLNPTLYPKDKLAYDTEKDLAPITGLVRINQALIANNGLQAQNARELIELANKKPGEITYGTAGVGSAPHMSIARATSG